MDYNQYLGSSAGRRRRNVGGGDRGGGDASSAYGANGSAYGPPPSRAHGHVHVHGHGGGGGAGSAADASAARVSSSSSSHADRRRRSDEERDRAEIKRRRDEEKRQRRWQMERERALQEEEQRAAAAVAGAHVNAAGGDDNGDGPHKGGDYGYGNGYGGGGGGGRGGAGEYHDGHRRRGRERGSDGGGGRAAAAADDHPYAGGESYGPPAPSAAAPSRGDRQRGGGGIGPVSQSRMRLPPQQQQQYQQPPPPQRAPPRDVISDPPPGVARRTSNGLLPPQTQTRHPQRGTAHRQVPSAQQYPPQPSAQVQAQNYQPRQHQHHHQHPQTTQQQHRSPAAAPLSSTSSTASTTAGTDPSPSSSPAIYDLFFDLPHPAASPSCPRAKMIDAPPRALLEDATAREVAAEMCDPSIISRVQRFAFPEFDEQGHAANLSFRQALRETSTSAGDSAYNLSSSSSSGANLNRYDVYLSTFRPSHHTFALQLSDGTRVHGHVRRYLPPHLDARSRSDVGRRGARAMVLLTRATGGERLYASVLKTVGALGAKDCAGDAAVGLGECAGSRGSGEANNNGVSSASYTTRDVTPERTFLHALHNHHSRLCREHAALVSAGGNLNFRPEARASTHGMQLAGLLEGVVAEDGMAGKGASASPSASAAGGSVGAGGNGGVETAHQFMEANENLFRVQIPGVEFSPPPPDDGPLTPSHRAQSHYVSVPRRPVSGDLVRFHLPPSLQPGYYSLSGPHSRCEDLHSPVLPLLRCLGAPHSLRLLSALLCERRIILVSRDASRLSACVRAASSLLAQGLLVWRHIQIPVLPPHLLKYLAAQTPFLIGLLQRYSSNLDVIPGMADVLCVNLDSNELRTYNMPEPAKTVPDLLKSYRRHRNADSVFSPAEVLAKDLAEILKSDRRTWSGIGGSVGSAGTASGAGGGASGGPASASSSGDAEKGGRAEADPRDEVGALFGEASGAGAAEGAGERGGGGGKKNKKFGGLFKKKSSTVGSTSGAAAADGSNHGGNVDAAAFLGSIMRTSQEKREGGGGAAAQSGEDEASSSHGGDYDDIGLTVTTSAEQADDPLPPLRTWESAQESLAEDGGLGGYLDPPSCCENERGEEEVRAALASFYLYLFGDMGMYLSEDARDGTLWLDQKKFLLLKKRMGERENSTMFRVMLKLSGSLMFEQFVRGRVREMDRAGRDRRLAMPHHLPLFVLCERYLRLNGLEFTQSNVRRIVSTTVVACPQHAAVERSESMRGRALALTSSQPFDGDVTAALASLVGECREVNGGLTHVVAVVWSRMGETRRSLWKHPLLALHLLKNLLLHGPLTAITEATDGLPRIRQLTRYASRHSDSQREVRRVATQVYSLLADPPKLFLKRRRIAAERTFPSEAISPSAAADGELRWGDYLVRRLPVTVSLRDIHMLVRPDEAVLQGAVASPSPSSSSTAERDRADAVCSSVDTPASGGGNGGKTDGEGPAGVEEVNDDAPKGGGERPLSPRPPAAATLATLVASRSVKDRRRRAVDGGAAAADDRAGEATDETADDRRRYHGRGGAHSADGLPDGRERVPAAGWVSADDDDDYTEDGDGEYTEDGDEASRYSNCDKGGDKEEERDSDGSRSGGRDDDQSKERTAKLMSFFNSTMHLEEGGEKEVDDLNDDERDVDDGASDGGAHEEHDEEATSLDSSFAGNSSADPRAGSGGRSEEGDDCDAVDEPFSRGGDVVVDVLLRRGDGDDAAALSSHKCTDEDVYYGGADGQEDGPTIRWVNTDNRRHMGAHLSGDSGALLGSPSSLMSDMAGADQTVDCQAGQRSDGEEALTGHEIASSTEEEKFPMTATMQQ